ncbi:NlpC/P60 family protein [Prosthecobacter sp.]|uniref:NlpC/P60 family protein n=1 Tax=Prosthecobacter sp. TaxID=1965333 RepID=UPI002AB9E618|nr:NlpC/P60 family protein [Prosthecobacter sp.]MDZ4404656.1 NlpC/P60 family protein [Prosthecobacter sp.]
MKPPVFLAALVLCSSSLPAADYQSPYKVDFTFKEEELISDLLKGPRADWKDQASVPFRDWYDPGNQRRWTHWGPAAKHFNPPAGLATKSPEWSRQRVIATGLRFAGYSYQHHHIPDWEPPADWPKDEKQTTPVSKGLDCSNFTAFVYNLALGIKPTGDVQDQAMMTEAAGPGAGRTIPVQRIEVPENYEDFAKTLLTGDLLFVKSNKGEVSHVVLWVGKIGKSPDGLPLILDSTGTGAKDSNGNEIPSGVQLRPFKRGFWYASKASHALRIIPEGK